MSVFTERPRLLLSAFAMNTTSHILGGQWRHPEAQQHRFNELGLWTDLARRLEDAKFDALFLADVVGLYGNHGGGWDSHVERGMQFPASDPLVLQSALAATTEHLGLALTSSVVQAHPFQFARQLSTLDHLSNGRVAWNIVTSVLENSFRNFGSDGLLEHDSRYDWADEYLEVCYKLWEGSWEEGALVQDKRSGRHADASKVHKINHDGARYSVEGPHLVAPSPQRTPLLFQAGSSGRGQHFAAANAEAAFLFAPNVGYVKKVTSAVRATARELGRRDQDIKFFAGLSFVVGSTEAEVRAKQADYDEHLDLDMIVAHIGGGIGVDLGGLPLDTTLGDLRTDGARGVLESVFASVPGGNPTIADLARYRAYNQQMAGTPEQIVDQLEAWQEAGIDGINIINQIIPGSYDDFIEGVLPELRKRGLAQTEYRAGTLREKFFGEDAQLPARHPAAAYRGAFAGLTVP
jgi:FMN-dependent oxidoreductase (nitrilotriacetate monooxygenase family)